jgi:hypothetical protein
MSSVPFGNGGGYQGVKARGELRDGRAAQEVVAGEGDG